MEMDFNGSALARPKQFIRCHWRLRNPDFYRLIATAGGGFFVAQASKARTGFKNLYFFSGEDTSNYQQRIRNRDYSFFLGEAPWHERDIYGKRGASGEGVIYNPANPVTVQSLHVLTWLRLF